MNIAILGPGGIADDQHAPAVLNHQGTTLWSVLSRSAERAEAFSIRHSLKAPNPAHTDLTELLSDPLLDAVIIATPDRLHSIQVLAAARARKHILLEKPMATSVSECDAMIDACRTNDVTLAMAYHLRWHRGHRMIRQQVGSGSLGALRHIRVHWTFQAPDGSNWRSSPETGRWWALAANGTHCLDLIRWMMMPTEGEITRIQSLLSSAKFGSIHDETAVVSLAFESGATAEFCVSVQFDSPSRIEIYGDAGSALLDGTMGRHGAGEIVLNGEPVSYSVENPFQAEFNDFIEAVREGRPPEVDGEEGRRNVALLLEAINDRNNDSNSI